MFFCLIPCTCSIDSKLKGQIAYNYGSCQGCITDVAELAKQIGDITDSETTVTVTLYGDLTITEEVKHEAILEFISEEGQVHTVNWVFGNPNLDLANTGLLMFGNVKVVPIIPQGSSSATLYGNGVDFTGELVVPQGITSLKGKFVSVFLNENTLSSFDELTYSILDVSFDSWPTKNIVWNTRIGSKTSLTLSNLEFNIDMGNNQVILKDNDQHAITINFKANYLIDGQREAVDFKVDFCDVTIQQTTDSDGEIYNIKFNTIKRSNITFTGKKISLFDLSNLDSNMEESSIYFTVDYIKSFQFNSNYVITKSMTFDSGVFYDNSPPGGPGLILSNPDKIDIVLKFNELTIASKVTVDPKITVEADILEINYNFLGSLVANNILTINAYNDIEVKSFKLNSNCKIVSEKAVSFSVTDLVLPENPKLFFTRRQSELDSFLQEMSTTGLDKLMPIICSTNAITLTKPTLIYEVDYYRYENFAPLFYNNDFIEADKDDKCIGVKFNKYINPKITMDIGGSGTENRALGKYNVDSFNSADWNIQPNTSILEVNILLNKADGELNLDALNLDKKAKLSIEGKSSSKINLKLSDGVISKFREVDLKSLEIESSLPVSWKCFKLDLTSVTILEPALTNMKFDGVTEIDLTQSQLESYDSILGKIKTLQLTLDSCDSIKFKQSTLEINSENNQLKKYTLKSGNVIISLSSDVSIYHEKGTRLKNVHINNNYYNIIFGDDWGDASDISPIYANHNYDKYVDVTKTTVIGVYIPDSYIDAPNIYSTESKTIKIATIFDESIEMDDYINLHLYSYTGSQDNKVNEFVLNDLSQRKVKFELYKDHNDVKITIKITIVSLEVPKVSQDYIKYYLALIGSDPYYSSLTLDQMRIGMQHPSDLNLNKADKLIFSSSANVSPLIPSSTFADIEFKIYVDSLIPYVSIGSKYASESKISFNAIDTDFKLKDIDQRFFNVEFVVANISGARCEELKPFTTSSGKAKLSIRCANEDMGSFLRFENAVFYAKLEVGSEGLNGGEIAGIVVGTVAGVGIIVVIVLFATGVIACSKKEDSAVDENERGAAEV